MTVKILIADDEPDLELLIRQRFRKQIRDKQYEFIFAHDGAEALQKLVQDPDITLLMSDINMPGMDGLTLLAKIKEAHPLIHPVIVSAYGDLTNIRTAMNRGAFDFLTKPIDFQDFEITLTKTLHQTQAVRDAEATREQLAAISRELDIARDMQQSILPRTFPPVPSLGSFDVHAVMHAARNVGGDFYDFFAIDGDRLAVVIGDVSGKGVPAAFVMAITRTLLRAVAARGDAAGACLDEVNRLLCRDSAEGMFVTLFYAIIHARTGAVEYCLAGHNPPYILRPGQAPERMQLTGDTVVGMIEELTFTSHFAQLRPGDGLFLYTDGVTEAMDAEKQQFGDDRLEVFLQRTGQGSTDEMIRGIVDEVKTFVAGAPQSDDLTALALRYRGDAR